MCIDMPMFLFNAEFSGISNDARVLYTLLRNRHELSIKNMWRDEDDRVYMYFRREEMQEVYYSGKKKRHTIKTQVVVDKKTRKVICTAFGAGKRHDFRLFKESKTHIHPSIKTETDTAFIGIKKMHANSVMPKKRSKKNPLTKEDKKHNKEISSSRVTNEHAIGFIKRFKYFPNATATAENVSAYASI